MPVLVSGFGVSDGWAFNVTLGLATFSSSPSALVLSSVIDIRVSAYAFRFDDGSEAFTRMLVRLYPAWMVADDEIRIYGDSPLLSTA